MVEGWQKATGQNLIDSIKNFVKIGFSEFLLTNVSKDGTLQGPDLEFLEKACEIKNVNVISSGGISKLDDIIKVKEKNAFGVILGKALYENLVSIEEAIKIV
jgi:phosphoribosylformimino-5-aminoimidazole carboxamide ribotide isomerase